MTRILVSAGEPSGDAHAARVVAALKQSHPALTIEGVGGPLMEAAGVELIAGIGQLGAVGLVEALRTLPVHWQLLKRLKRRLAAGRYDAVLVVDYPGFHLRLAAAARSADVPVLYYIAPQAWAWGGWRLRSLRERVRALAVILPFEEPYFRARDIPATFVGHPLLDGPAAPSREEARRTLGLDADRPVLAVCPGSRAVEVNRLLPTFRAAVRRLRHQVPGLEAVLLDAAGAVGEDVPECSRWRGASATLFAAADAGLCKSGTTTLEAALAGMPMVVAYRMHPATFAIARRAVRVPDIALVNLVAGRRVVPELVQRAATDAALARAARPLLERDGAEATQQRAAFAAIRTAMGAPGAARRVAELVRELAA
ncbi:MAG: lipid-A-disaccharide synthase [Gemmatimonadota bacterium]|nr:MAG: lipid-A-disaccharide synthase [Gemmatimonadota bacterium]